MVNKVKVRFAPSPTGIPHVGNIRTALFDYFYAKSNDGIFILRIEDTDQARKVEGATEAIKESLLWLGAKWDEYVVQSERLNEYKKYAAELLEKGLAKEESGAIRFIVSKSDSIIKWKDAVGDKEVSYRREDIEDFIILKADGFPTYHLANVVDDHLMNITHVIRGEDWIPSTPKHILLYQAFGWKVPIFAHVPNVLGEDGKKLSKRKGAKSVMDYKKEGYLGDALLNYLMLLGWSPKNDVEVLSKEEIIKDFSLENLNSSPAKFDTRKLNWINGEYIRKLSVSDLAKKLTEFDSSVAKGLSENDYLKYVASAQTRIKTLLDFRKSVEPFKNITKKDNPLLSKLANELEEISEWSSQNISSKIIEFMKIESIHYPAIYEALIGEKQGLPIGDVFEIIGREKILSLLK